MIPIQTSQQACSPYKFLQFFIESPVKIHKQFKYTYYNQSVKSLK